MKLKLKDKGSKMADGVVTREQIESIKMCGHDIVFLREYANKCRNLTPEEEVALNKQLKALMKPEEHEKLIHYRQAITQLNIVIIEALLKEYKQEPFPVEVLIAGIYSSLNAVLMSCRTIDALSGHAKQFEAYGSELMKSTVPVLMYDILFKQALAEGFRGDPDSAPEN